LSRRSWWKERTARERGIGGEGERDGKGEVKKRRRNSSLTKRAEEVGQQIEEDGGRRARRSYTRTLLTSSNKSRTLPFENRKNIACIALSPDGQVLISIDAGE